MFDFKRIWKDLSQKIAVDVFREMFLSVMTIMRHIQSPKFRQILFDLMASFSCKSAGEFFAMENLSAMKNAFIFMSYSQETKTPTRISKAYRLPSEMALGTFASSKKSNMSYTLLV